MFAGFFLQIKIYVDSVHNFINIFLEFVNV